jgi:uncharacterized protein YecE (DUF72 family)
MIWVGTSGFQYPEWKGSFYPSTLSTAKMLPFYAGHFSTTEINYSFYRIPSVKTLAGWSAATPLDFRFSLKAPQEITHVRKLRACTGVLNRFVEALGALEKKLGPVLFQLPPSFRKDRELLVEFLGSLAPGLKCAFEFRHSSWFDNEIFGLLKANHAALCIAESTELAVPVVFTADFAYFRLRREGYTKANIVRWAGVIAAQRAARKDIYVYFKHEEAGVGPKFAKQFLHELNGSAGR